MSARKRTLCVVGTITMTVAFGAAITAGAPAQAHTPTTAATAVAAARSTTPAPRASVAPAVAGERVTLTLRLPQAAARPVHLQVRRSTGWVTVARGTSTARGDVRLAHVPLTRPGSAAYRVVAPAVTKPRRFSAFTTPTTTVLVVAQSTRLTLPSGVAVGGKTSVVTQSTPARAGRPMVLQRQDDWGQWRTVATVAQDRQGRASFPVTRRSDETLRVVATAHAGTPASASAAVTWPLPGAITQVDVARTVRDNLYDWVNWAAPDDLTYSVDASGALQVMGRTPDGKNLRVDRLDATTFKPLGVPRLISLAGWSEWGGIYTAPDGHVFVLIGNLNEAENDSADVIQIRRYDPNWNLVGTGHVKGGASHALKGIWEPFGASAAHMTQIGDRLVVHMGRGMYRTNDGARHQSNFTFEVDIPTMTARTFEELADNRSVPYVSHSFQTLVAMHRSELVLVDHGDAYPRSLRMTVVPNYPQQRTPVATDLMRINGQIGDNYTGTAVTGLVSGTAGVVVVGNSVRHDAGKPFKRDETRNVFTIAADPATGKHEQSWLTNFAPNAPESVGHPRVVTVGQDRFAILFTVTRNDQSRLEYRLIDSTGAPLAQRSFPGVPFPAGAEPITVGERIVWVASGSDSDTTFVFGLEMKDPTAPSLAGG